MATCAFVMAGLLLTFACGTNENGLTDPSPTGGAEFFEFVDNRNQIRDNEFRGIVSERSAKFLIDRYGPSGVIERTGEASFVGITDIAEAIVTPISVSGSLNDRISTYDGRDEPNRTTSSLAARTTDSGSSASQAAANRFAGRGVHNDPPHVHTCAFSGRAVRRPCPSDHGGPD